MPLTEAFAIPTPDGPTLHGQIDFPSGKSCSPDRLPLLLIVPGGGFMDRDGQLGDTGTERDLVYRDLARDVNQAGIAVLRWDIRGVSGNGFTMPTCPDGLSPADGLRHFLRSCVDEGVRAGVTPENLLADIEQAFRFASEHPRVDPDQIIVWAHSEGTLNVARLVGSGRISPRGLILVGPIVESPIASQWWLEVGRVVERVMAWDRDRDGRVSRDEVTANYPSDFLFQALATPLQELLPERDFWTEETLRDRFEQRYERERAETLATDDAVPFAFPAPVGFPRPVFASYRWRKQWYLDETLTVDLLVDYAGPVVYHFGAIDSQNPVASQVRLLEKKIPAFRVRPQVVLHRDRGHTLRSSHPLLGPMDTEAKEMLVQDALDILRGIPANA